MKITYGGCSQIKENKVGAISPDTISWSDSCELRIKKDRGPGARKVQGKSKGQQEEASGLAGRASLRRIASRIPGP